uniref:Uncharacterized protein n=1 Tax=Monomastix sp. (strain OKE-1) TaxID=141716 RepID=U5YDM3_MONSK|nr:hypothetical protein [Monomastix sp. OKE-1]AGZ90179.1 hypothetical protein [Monomastix sp. OKE-1]
MKYEDTFLLMFFLSINKMQMTQVNVILTMSNHCMSPHHFKRKWDQGLISGPGRAPKICMSNFIVDLGEKQQQQIALSMHFGAFNAEHQLKCYYFKYQSRAALLNIT